MQSWPSSVCMLRRKTKKKTIKNLGYTSQVGFLESVQPTLRRSQQRLIHVLKVPLRLEESAGLCQHRVRDHTPTFMESRPFYSPRSLSSCRCRLGAILHRKPFEAQGEIDSSPEPPFLNGLKFKLNIPEDENSL